MLKIGLTGGIASGKTTVSDLFRSLGITIIDADVLAREIVEPQQPALNEIVMHFGKQLVDKKGALERKKLRALIFSDADKRKQLEVIMHPRIRQRIFDQVALVAKNSHYCIISIPLLIENNWQNMLDRILVVDIDEALQLSRTCQRDNISQKSALAIIQSQASRQQRLSFANDIIRNDGDKANLQQQILKLHKNYLQL